MKHLFIGEIEKKRVHNKKNTITHNEDVDLLIQEWRKQLLVNNENFFERKLLNENIATEEFSELLNNILSSKSNINISRKVCLNNLNIGLLEIFHDFLDENFSEIETDLNYFNTFFSINKDKLLQSYKNRILSLIWKISEKTIFHESKLWEERYDKNISDFNLRLKNHHYKYYFYNKYPLLIRLVNDEIKRAKKFLIAILTALKEDWKSIEQIVTGYKFLEDLQFGLGDRHADGKSVTLIIFNDNLKIFINHIL